ncbi:MAG: Ig-like domain-containing protein [candidate division KSB1 bacterium]|nr:Ig-like domain-containing protein [candidate division KSB1 bacterium]
MKRYSKLWLIPLLLVMIMASCEDRVGITSVQDDTAPTVSFTDPAKAEAGVPLNQKIAATFSTTMDSSTISTATFTLMQGSTPVSGVVLLRRNSRFAPSSNLEPNTTYTATITTGAKDLAGTALENNYEWSFTTGASTVVTRPTVISTDLADAETDMWPLNQKIAATFSTTMDSSTISTATFTLMQGSTPVSGVVSYSGETAVFAPSSNLEPNTTYTATITTGAKDLAGTALENNYEWSFTTGASTVVTSPTVISTDPADAETDVALNQKIAATFSTTMDLQQSAPQPLP